MHDHPFIPKTYVQKTTRIILQEGPHDVLNFFVDTNHTSGHVSIEDGFQRIVPVDIRVIPDLIEVLKAEYNAHLDFREKEAEMAAKEKEKHDAKEHADVRPEL